MTLRNYSSTAAETTLSAGVDASTTTLLVSATTGFPATPFILAVDAGAAAQELVLVTNVAGTTLTVTRAYDSTVASAHDTGAVVAHSHGAIDFREANSHVNATSGVHGVSGALVGASETQALTNKDLSSGSNTFPASMVTTTGTQTLSNKTLTAPAIDGAVGGATFGAWTAYGTPTTVLTGATSDPSLGTGAQVNAYYQQVGKTVHYRIRVVVGTGQTVGSGEYRFLLPVAARLSVGQDRNVGIANIGNATTSIQGVFVPELVSATQVRLISSSNLVVTSNAFDVSGVGQTYSISGTYEAA